MPTLGSGVLGRHLLALVQRLGPGEFHSLRDYVSRRRAALDPLAGVGPLREPQGPPARGARACGAASSCSTARRRVPSAGHRRRADVFERAIVAAGSLVLSADRAGLTTRFVTGGVDLRGPDVAAHALHLLAPIAARAAARRPRARSRRGPRSGHRRHQPRPLPTRGGAPSVIARPDADPGRRVHRRSRRRPARSAGVDASTLADFRIGWTGSLVRAGCADSERRRQRQRSRPRRDGGRHRERPPRARATSARLPPIERDLAATLALAAYSMRSRSASPASSATGSSCPTSPLLVDRRPRAVVRAAPRSRVSGVDRDPGHDRRAVVGAVAWYQYRSTLSADRSRSGDLGRRSGSTSASSATSSRPPWHRSIYEVGWATLASARRWCVVIVMADTFAFRAEARGEALVPGGVLFVFIAALGAHACGSVRPRAADRHRHPRRGRAAQARTTAAAGSSWPATAAGCRWRAAVGGRRRRRDRRAGGRASARASRAPTPSRCTTRAAAAAGITEVLSPLVDIRSRLVNRGNVELFRVNADAEAYWRSDDAARVRRAARVGCRSARSTRRRRAGPTTEGARIRQQVQILALGGQLAAGRRRPDRRRSERRDPAQQRHQHARQDDATSRPVSSSRSCRARPRFGADVLRARHHVEPARRDLPRACPTTSPTWSSELALEVTAGATTDYDQMLALQNWFQTFTYSTEVQSGHGSNAIESFLEIRIGYCEQFAATMATMARTLGIPSRVAVGFTPGVLRADGWYSVLGKNAHAWPEIWFDGIGWVAVRADARSRHPGRNGLHRCRSPARTPHRRSDGGDPGRGQVVPAHADHGVPPPSTGPTATRRPDPDAQPQRPPTTTAGGMPRRRGRRALWPGRDRRPASLVAVAARRSRGGGGVVSCRQHAGHAARGRGLAPGLPRRHPRRGPGRPSMTSSEWASATAHAAAGRRPADGVAGRSVIDRFEFARPGLDVDDLPESARSATTASCGPTRSSASPPTRCRRPSKLRRATSPTGTERRGTDTIDAPLVDSDVGRSVDVLRSSPRGRAPPSQALTGSVAELLAADQAHFLARA